MFAFFCLYLTKHRYSSTQSVERKSWEMIIAKPSLNAPRLVNKIMAEEQFTDNNVTN